MSLNIYNTKHSTNNIHAVVRILCKQRIGLKICHINAQSLVRKIDELRFVMENSGIDIICISETWFVSSMWDNLFNMNGFQLFRADREGHGGGVAIYIRSGVNVRFIEKSKSDSKIEYLFVEVLHNNCKVLVGCIYRPNKNIDFTDLFQRIDLLTLNYVDTIICGDFNSNLLVEETLLSSMLTLGLFPVNTTMPTHFTKTTNTLLDLFLVSNKHKILLYDQLSVPGFSKHDMIFCIYDFDLSVSNNMFSFRDYKSINLDQLTSKVLSINWNSVYNMPSANDQLCFIQNSVLSLYNECVPIKTKYIKAGQKPWFTNIIQIKINERNLAYSNWKKYKTDALYEIFKTARKNVNIATKYAKINFYKSKFNAAISTKEKWKQIKNLGINKNTQNQSEIIDLDELNRKFVDVPVNPVIYNAYENVQNNCQVISEFSFKCVSQLEVYSSIMSIKSNATGVDDISPKFMHLIIPILLPFLTHMFNTILMTSDFPSDWKCSKVIPIKKTLLEFRPISILPFLSKCLEKIIQSQISEYLDSNKLLHEKQSGFRAKRSCMTALIDVTEGIRESVDNGNITFLTLLDHSKAFDCVDPSILCSKLKNMFKFSSTATRLIYSYLTNRHQTVFSDNKYSCVLPVTRGVPQGSILGPLLFSIYINDLPTSLLHSKIHMYADDVQIYTSCKVSELVYTINLINDELLAINTWASKNGLGINPSKSKCLVIAKRKFETQSLPKVHINNNEIEFVNSAKNLGVMFNRTLSWSNHINLSIGNVCSRLRSLWVTQEYTPLNIRIMLAKTYILPSLLYGCELFVNSDSESKRKLKVVFNKITRYVFGLKYNDNHVSEMSKKIYGMSIDKYINLRSLILLHKIIYTKEPFYLYEKIKFCRSNRSLNIIVPRHNSSFSEHQFYIYVIRLWNNLPNFIKFIVSAEKFKLELNRLFID